MIFIARIVKLVCLCLIVLYVIGRLPIPLLVIPLVGCTVVYVTNEIKEIRDEKQSKKKKKVKRSTSKK